MAVKLGNRALQTSTTSGTGSLTLDPVSGSSETQSLADALGLPSNGSTAKTRYVIEQGGDWEIGIGTLTKGINDTLSRDTVIESTNYNSKVSFSSSSKNVMIALPSNALESLTDRDAGSGFLTQTSADNYTRRTITAGQDITISNGNGVSGNPSISVATTFSESKRIETDTLNTQFTISNANNASTNDGGSVVFNRSANTTSSPTPVLDKFNLGTVEFNGYDGSDMAKGASIVVKSDGNWTTSNHPSRIIMGVGDVTGGNVIINADAGVTIGTPTGGSKGVGTLNALGVYDDNTLLTCYPIEYAVTGSIDLEKWDSIAGGTHQPAHEFYNNTWRLDPEKYAQYWKENRHLPGLPAPNETETKSLGDMVQRLWETVEVLSIHIDKLNQRIKQLEKQPDDTPT